MNSTSAPNFTSPSNTPSGTSTSGLPTGSLDMRMYKICVEQVSNHTNKQLQTIRYIAGGGEASSKAQAAFLKSNIWPDNSVIRISFGDVNYEELSRRGIYDAEGKKLAKPQPFYNPVSNLSPPLDPLSSFVENEKDPRVSIRKIVDERIQKLVNLKFTYVDKFEDGDIRIAFNNDGAWSYIGTDVKNVQYAGKPTMNFGWIDAPTVIHELGHSIGLVHEHSNPNGIGIPWNVEAVELWAKETQGWDNQTTEDNIIKKYSVDQINGSIFDPDSIMLYYYPARLTEGSCCGTKMNCRLSSTDVIWISNIYGKGAPMTAEEFYKYAYNEPLNRAVPIAPRPRVNDTESFKELNCYANRCTKRQQIENFQMPSLKSIFESTVIRVIFCSILVAILFSIIFSLSCNLK